MSGTADQPTPAGLEGLARVSRELGSEPDPFQALWRVVCALRQDLALDRAGVFAYDPHHHRLDHVAGVSAAGEAEFGVESFPVAGVDLPLQQVARGELPYYVTDDVLRDYPGIRLAAGVKAAVIVPITAGGEFLGALCADNCLSGAPIPEGVVEPLFLFAGLAALPLFALFQKRERERIDSIRRRLHREVLFAATSGKIRLCQREEIDAEWPAPLDPIPIETERDIPRLREQVRSVAIAAGMAAERAGELELCVSEAATNALMHGGGGAAFLAEREGRVRVRITDRGAGIHPDDLPRATLMRGWSRGASLGMGFTLISETADRLYLHTDADGTTVILEMAVVPARPLQEGNPLLWGEAVF